MTLSSQFQTKRSTISPHHRPYLIAEIGLNHNNDVALGKELIARAKESGADAVKFQSYTTDLFVNKTVEKAKGLYDIFKQFELNEEAHRLFSEHAASVDIDFFSTPLTLDWPARLAALDVPFFKVASGDLNNYALLLELIKHDIPLIVSTGASNRADILANIAFFKEREIKDVLYLHCVSQYPTPESEANLATVPALHSWSQALVGFSDHTEATNAAFAAVVLGACVIEKHFTSDVNLPGPDQKLSATPKILAELRSRIDLAFEMRGEAREQPSAVEAQSDFFGKRSLYEIDGELVPMRPRQENMPKDSDFLSLG